VDGAIITRPYCNYASTHEIRQLPFWGRGIGRKSDILLSDTAIVFSLAFVMVQFSSTTYSPRLVLWLSRDPIIWHAMGIFTATFLFALVALGWVDRNGSGHVPFFSTGAVIVLLIASVLVLARLVQRLTILQVTEVLYYISQWGELSIPACPVPIGAVRAIGDHAAHAAPPMHSWSAGCGVWHPGWGDRLPAGRPLRARG
jgi:hypothetical protein